MKPFETQFKAISDKVAWRAFQNLIECFNFNDEEAKILIGNIPQSKLRGLNEHECKLNRDQKERISYLLGIYKNLLTLFTDRAQAFTWIERENQLPPFNGMTPKQYLLEGSMIRLANVRRFLDAFGNTSNNESILR